MSRSPSKQTKFFNLSWLALFPGFGIIIGIVLLRYSIFKFKSVKLTARILLLMLGGIALVIIDTSYLKHDLMYSKDAGKRFAILAQDELDTIASKLELYRLQAGTYPENLGQLKAAFPDITIRDPLLSRNQNAHSFINFYYKRVGDKYLLFSSGIDGIPNTHDDIFPHISHNDTTTKY